MNENEPPNVEEPNVEDSSSVSEEDLPILVEELSSSTQVVSSSSLSITLVDDCRYESISPVSDEVTEYYVRRFRDKYFNRMYNNFLRRAASPGVFHRPLPDMKEEGKYYRGDTPNTKVNYGW